MRGIETRLAKLEANADTPGIVVLELPEGLTEDAAREMVARLAGPRCPALKLTLCSRTAPADGRMLVETTGARHEDWLDAMEAVDRATASGAVLIDIASGSMDDLADEVLEGTIDFIEAMMPPADLARHRAEMRELHGADFYEGRDRGHA